MIEAESSETVRCTPCNPTHPTRLLTADDLDRTNQGQDREGERLGIVITETDLFWYVRRASWASPLLIQVHDTDRATAARQNPPRCKHGRLIQYRGERFHCLHDAKGMHFAAKALVMQN